MDRRSFLKLGAAAVAAPYVITTPGLLMPVKSLWTRSYGRSPIGDALADTAYARQYAESVALNIDRIANLVINPPIIIPRWDTGRGEDLWYQTARMIGGPQAGMVMDFSTPIVGTLTPAGTSMHERMALLAFNRLAKKVNHG